MAIQAGFLPVFGGTAIIKTMSIKEVKLPPFLPAGAPINIPVTVTSILKVRQKTILIKIIDTLPDGKKIQIGELSAQQPPGERVHKVPIKTPDVVGIDTIRVELFAFIAGIIPRLQAVFEKDIEKIRLTQTQP